MLDFSVLNFTLAFSLSDICLSPFYGYCVHAALFHPICLCLSGMQLLSSSNQNRFTHDVCQLICMLFVLINMKLNCIGIWEWVNLHEGSKEYRGLCPIVQMWYLFVNCSLYW